MDFYERLVEETQGARRALYATPQLERALQGDISRESYIAYLTQAYHHVRHTVPFLMGMGAALPEEKHWLLKPIAEYIREEIGHEEWILNDIAASGGDRDAARLSRPSRETALLVAYNYDYIRRRNPVGFLGMVYMLESTSVDIAAAGANAVMRGLGLPKYAFSYLLSHGALDAEHIRFFESVVRRIDDPADLSAIVEVAQTTFGLFAGVLAGIPWEGGIRHAA